MYLPFYPLMQDHIPANCSATSVKTSENRLGHARVRPLLAAAVAGVAIAGLLLPAASAQPDDGPNRPHAGMLRFPDASADSIVFSYGNDLWVAPRDGGTARPLASPPGLEINPKFSPDGSRIAFVGNYAGDRDIYVVDSFGGPPQRITYHPDHEQLQDWAGDDGVLYSARGLSNDPVAMQTQQLFIQSIDGTDENGGLPRQLPIPYGASASLSEDGNTLAYTPHSTDFRTWKRYRGGMATDIWLFNLEDKTAVQATDWEGTDTAPMLHDGKLYYLSDNTQNARLNLFEYDPESGERRQLTDFTDFDVKFPSMAPGPDGEGEIVFQQASNLYLLGLAEDAEPQQVEVIIPGVKPALRPRTVDAADFMQGGNISATGKRVVAEARGDIWSLPAETGIPRQLTETDGAAERNPAWSPDGRWIVYSSDEEGEYNLYLMQSDGKGNGPYKLTDTRESFWWTPEWSPDSSQLVVQDHTGQIYLISLDVEEGDQVAVTADVKEIDADPLAQGRLPFSWSTDSKWIAYHRGDDDAMTTAVYLYDVEAGEAHKVTSDMFSAQSPTFDRKGQWLYYISQMDFSNPEYSSADTSFVYQGIDRLVAVPLNGDVENPMLKELDEEEFKAGEDEESTTRPATQSTTQSTTQPATRPTTDEASDDGDEEEEAAAADQFNLDSKIHGKWSGTLHGFQALGAPDDEVPFEMTIYAHKDGTYTGKSVAMGQTSDFDSISFDEEAGAFSATGAEGPVQSTMSGTVTDGKIEGAWTASIDGNKLADGAWNATREGGLDPEELADAAGADKDEKGGEGQEVKIDLEGFESRGILLPVPRGNLSSLAVNDKNQLIYARRDDGPPSLKLLDLTDEEISEGSVIGGVGGFSISGDGKKLLVYQYGPGGARGGIINAAKGQSIGEAVPTDGMDKAIEDPREEWKQLVTDTWRRFRDFFYVENMHGVDWDGVLAQYLPMVDDAATREDVSYIISEMISELNVGHAYYRGGESLESEPSKNVGLLGADFEVAGEGDQKAYRIERILNGASYDIDARSPLTLPGVDVKEGDYLLAVNGKPLDTGVSPYAAFLGMAGDATVLTVSDKPTLDSDNENQRDVTVTPISSENELRYREWIADNARRVDEMSDGRIGYIYVPNTGTNGQNDLFRQFYGQAHKDALIIDERWNGGGQIPTRFIELLNRPTTNYWARRHGRDWKWPPDGHSGPKAMLINGLAGSGGDMFPWLFKHNDLGPLIGTRTWGGLVGISGVPPLIDGGSPSVPNFGFYEVDGTWGIEGHGVDPDIEVVADPSKMQDGADPQLKAAVDHLLQALEENPPKEIERPADPDRAGMGITEEDR